MGGNSRDIGLMSGTAHTGQSPQSCRDKRIIGTVATTKASPPPASRDRLTDGVFRPISSKESRCLAVRRTSSAVIAIQPHIVPSRALPQNTNIKAGRVAKHISSSFVSLVSVSYNLSVQANELLTRESDTASDDVYQNGSNPCDPNTVPSIFPNHQRTLPGR